MDGEKKKDKYWKMRGKKIIKALKKKKSSMSQREGLGLEMKSPEKATGNS